MATHNSSDNLKQLASRYLADHGKTSGIVLFYEGIPYGWKNELRDPSHERPGVFAVDRLGGIFQATGGNDLAGAEQWRRVSETRQSRTSTGR